MQDIQHLYQSFVYINSGWDLAEWVERPTANAEVAVSDRVESEGRQMKQCWIKYWKKN